MSQTKYTVLKLDVPIEYQGSAITQLNIRRPKGKDMRFLPKGEDVGAEDMFPFFALLCGVDEPVIDELDISDIQALGDIVNGFLKTKKTKR